MGWSGFIVVVWEEDVWDAGFWVLLFVVPPRLVGFFFLLLVPLPICLWSWSGHELRGLASVVLACVGFTAQRGVLVLFGTGLGSPLGQIDRVRLTCRY